MGWCIACLIMCWPCREWYILCHSSTWRYDSRVCLGVIVVAGSRIWRNLCCKNTSWYWLENNLNSLKKVRDWRNNVDAFCLLFLIGMFSLHDWFQLVFFAQVYADTMYYDWLDISCWSYFFSYFILSYHIWFSFIEWHLSSSSLPLVLTCKQYIFPFSWNSI